MEIVLQFPRHSELLFLWKGHGFKKSIWEKLKHNFITKNSLITKINYEDYILPYPSLSVMYATTILTKCRRVESVSFPCSSYTAKIAGPPALSSKMPLTNYITYLNIYI